MNLKNNEAQALSSVNSGKAELSPVRVFSVILDSEHPRYTGEDSIGTIFYGRVDANESSINLDNLNRAKPLFSFVRYYPLVNEIVLVFNSTSRNVYQSIGGDSAFVSTYYLPNINIWNNSHHNALPLEDQLRREENPQEASTGIQQNNVTKNPIKLGEYFSEKETLKTLQPFEGDMILEGRFGNSMRFGSSNPRGKNNWSENDSIGDPITIIANGQPTVSGDTILEDINSIDSSIFMLSNQNLNNFTPASPNLQSLGTTLAPAPNPQILIVDTPDPPVRVSPAPPVIESPEPIIRETPQVISPPTEEEITPQVEVDDPIFALLDEAQDEGELSYTTSVYSFGEIEPELRAAPRPEEYIPPVENVSTPIVNDATYTNLLPENLVPSKVRYKPVYIDPRRKWTSLPKTRLASIIKVFNIPNSLKYSVMFVAIKEQGKGDKVGGYNNNHYGIMADIGRWRFGSLINGAVPSTEGAGGQGIRTDKIRYFASFPTTENGIDFMAKTLEGKGFSGATQNNIVDLYIDRWLSPAKETADRIKRDKRQTYSNLFLTAKNLIDNAV